MNIFKNRTFTWWQMGLLKSCLISLGIIVGVSFQAYVSRVMWLWWTVFVIIAIYFIARFFRNDA